MASSEHQIAPSASSDKKPIPALGSSIVTLLVGPETSAQTFFVDESILRQASSTFDAALSSGYFIEGRKGTIKLPEESPTVITRFISWLYTSRISTVHDLPLINDDDLVDLYAFGERWLIKDLRALCFGYVREQYQDEITYNSCFELWERAGPSKIWFFFAMQFMWLVEHDKRNGYIDALMTFLLERCGSREFFLDVVLAGASGEEGGLPDTLDCFEGTFWE